MTNCWQKTSPVSFTFLGPLAFEIRSRLQKCFKNYIPCCSLKVIYQFKNRIANVFNFKGVVNTTLSSYIVDQFIFSLLPRNLLWSKTNTFFVRTSKRLGITPLTGKFARTPKKYAIFDHMLLDGHKANFENFSILLKENNAFKLQSK